MKLVLVLKEKFVIKTNDIVERGLAVMLINAINQEADPVSDEFIIENCKKFELDLRVI